ncbi:hypothetical protein KMZ32_10790 [Phycicoccus sp. MAQZ13P-2]|uniref:hypothetical protein n=1 Tax=Phycicoccus mangrovi TaxID=2840470 RepID=UPI001C0053E9|nr:hypothetical protein [Phycicoccus mangrovi]MBT9255962.1 hypothetical protein [Phycicoccus mangrovi]MBT9274556.1 hypothetical protein [Phycicoccus mangrovi]
MTGPLHAGWFAAATDPLVRVLVLHRPDGEPAPLDPGATSVGVRTQALEPPADALPALREGRVRAASLVAARGRPAVARVVHDLKRSADLRRAVTGGVDLVVSSDPLLDAALDGVPAVLHGLPLVRSTDVPALRSLLADLTTWAERLEAVAEAGSDPLAVPDDELAPPRLAPVPGAPTTLLVADLTRRLAGRSRTLGGRAARLAGRILRPDGGAALASGLAAQEAAAGLVLDPDPGATDLDRLSAVARGTLEAADAALAAGRGQLALALLSDALLLLFHRELHADGDGSPLVDTPERFLADLVASTTFRAVTSGGRGALARERTQEQRAAQDRAPVAVVTGAYGTFHPEVVAALETVGGLEVDVVDLARRQTFSAKPLTPDALAALTLLRRWPAGPGVPDRRQLRRTETDLLRDLAAVGDEHRAVFSDWADKSTAFLSHALPPGPRLSMRIHRVDAFDPWFVLTDWTRVAEVVVVSPAFRDLVRALLAVLGHDVPVRVVPSFGSIEGLARPKTPGARTRLGLIGWSRRPKDPLWAFDLLERCPGYTLVCVGAPPTGAAVPTVAGRAYHAEVDRRLAELGDRVEVVGWTDDVPAVLQGIGVILSTSRSEGCHRGLIEGAGSGAVPVVRDWPLLASRGGPHGLVDDAWVVTTVEQAAERLVAVTHPDTWPAAVTATAARAADLFDGSDADATYVEVVLGSTP